MTASNKCGWRTTSTGIFRSQIIFCCCAFLYITLYLSSKCFMYSNRGWMPLRPSLISNSSSSLGRFEQLEIPFKMPIAISGLILLFIVCCSIVVILRGNLSLRIVKHLACEPKIVQLCVLHILNNIIALSFPDSPTSYSDPLAYFISTLLFITVDATIEIERWFVLTTGLLMLSITIFVLFDSMIMMNGVGVPLISMDNGIVVYKRQAQITVYTNILSLIAGGILSTVQDKKHERFIFLSGHLFRSTGTPDRVHRDHRRTMFVAEEFKQSSPARTAVVPKHKNINT